MSTDPATAAWTDTMAQRTVGSLTDSDIEHDVRITFGGDTIAGQLAGVFHGANYHDGRWTGVWLWEQKGEHRFPADTPCEVTP